MTIYIDSDYKCHVEQAEGLTAVDVAYFDGKDAAVVEAYRFVPAGCTWTREDGVTFNGEMLSPHSAVPEQDTNDEYAQMQAEVAEYEAAYNQGVQEA